MGKPSDLLNQPAPAARNARKGGAAAAAIALILGGVYAVEGGYSNNKKDPGGATMYGVTEEVARANGYRGDMRRFPKHCDGPATACADNIYVSQYIAAPGYMPRPNRWFRLTMNKLASTKLPNSSAALRTDDITAYRMVQVKLGKTAACVATLDALDGRQEAEYQRLVARNGALRRFLRGWLRARIGNVDRDRCGKGVG
jgi:hypothetical protein